MLVGEKKQGIYNCWPEGISIFLHPASSGPVTVHKVLGGKQLIHETRKT